MDALKANGLAEKLVYLNPTEPFNLYLKIAALAGLFLTSPFVLYQVWMFISPGLYRNEKRYVMPVHVFDHRTVHCAADTSATRSSTRGRSIS